MPQEVLNQLIAILDWFLPDELRAHSRYSDRQRARVIIGMAIFGFFLTSSVLFVNDVLPEEFKLSVYLILGVCVFCVTTMKFLNWSLMTITVPSSFVLSTALLLGIRAHGVAFSGLVSWIPVYIMLSLFLCEIKWGLVVAAYLSLGNLYLSLNFLERGIQILPTWDEQSWLKLLIVDQQYAAFFATILVTYFLYTIKHSEKELANSRDIILRQQETLYKTSRMTELGELAGGIAHEINNPLAIILGANQRIKRELAQSCHDKVMIGEMCDKIDRTALRITKIISGLKNYSRDGESDPMEVVRLEKIFEDVTEIFKEKFNFNQIRFEIISEFDQTPFWGRYVQVYQIIVNLVSNALDAIESCPEKFIAIEVDKDESGFICISVIDSGLGIPIEIEEKVFNPFFTTKPVGKGTGLGLSIAAGIMAEHGGNIYIDRAHNDSRITLKFPLVGQVDQKQAS
ncbi:MAG: HAMP domain-containing histidine kinase [Bdellovibrionales bacterium]|nr:HAMP domain-containing histidine kinase [Bdellovibrionales bacterium]